MKTYLVPYCVPSVGSWWCGIDVCNFSDSESTLEVNVYADTGYLAKSFDVTLGAMQSRVLLSEELKHNLSHTGRCKVVIVGGDDLEVTPLQACGAEGFGIMPVKVFDGVKKF